MIDSDRLRSTVNDAIRALSPAALRMIKPDEILGDDVKVLTDELRGASAGEESLERAADERRTERARKALLGAVSRLEAQVERVIAARSGSERRAETLLLWGGITVIVLPLVSVAASLWGREIGGLQALLSGGSAAGFLALMFGPGREIRRAAADRTALMLVPVGIYARVVAASSEAELRAIAEDLDRMLRTPAVAQGEPS